MKLISEPNATATIVSSPDNNRLTSVAIDRLEAKHGHKKGWRRLPVSNFLLSINTNMRSGDCFANCDNDARLYKWPTVVVTAIRAGINHLFYRTKL